MRFKDVHDQLWLCDCREGLKRLADKIVDLTVTSCPWDNIFKYGGNHNWSWAVFVEVAKELYRVTKDGGIVCWDIADGIEDGVCSGTTERMVCYFMDLGFSKYEKLVIHNHMRPTSTNRRHGLPPEEVFVFSKGSPATVNRRTKPNRPASVGLKFNNYQRTFDGSPGLSSKSVIKPVGKRGPVWSYHPLCPKCGTEWSGQMRFTTWPQFDEFSSVRPYYNVHAASNTKPHPARMSSALVRDLILAYSKEQELVLDPFTGSGTTPKCAVLTNRSFLGMEIHKEYYQIAERRVTDALALFLKRAEEDGK